MLPSAFKPLYGRELQLWIWDLREGLAEAGAVQCDDVQSATGLAGYLENYSLPARLKISNRKGGTGKGKH